MDANTNRLTAPAGSTMTYDATGNLTFDNSDGFGGTRSYDAENQMKQAWANNQWQTYSYDGDGRRVKRLVKENNKPGSGLRSVRFVHLTVSASRWSFSIPGRPC